MWEAWQQCCCDGLSGVEYKPGVSGSPSPAIQRAISVAEAIYSSYGVTLVVTSLRDGVHMPGSLHYSGNAVDLRRWDLDRVGKTSQVVSQLRAQLGSSYDVILEGDHIHVEYEGAAQPGSGATTTGSGATTTGSPAPPAPDPPGGQIDASLTVGVVAFIVLAVIAFR